MADTIIPTSLATARTQVLSLCNDASVGFQDNTEIDNWIKEGCVDVSSKALAYENTDNAVLVANQVIYTTLETLGDAGVDNIVKVVGAAYTDSSGKYKGMVRVKPKVFGYLATKQKGPSKYYFHWGKKIYILPAPTSAEVAAGGKAVLFFSQVTDDITKLADWYQMLPILFAFSRALLKDGKVASSNSIYSRYLNAVIFHRSDLHDLLPDSKKDFEVPD